jgi:hypothetical protein
MDFILKLLASLVALDGNQVMDLDYQTFQLGRATHRELAGYSAVAPFQNASQLKNYAVLCATLDWNPTAAIPRNPGTPDQMRLFAEQFLSVPPNNIQQIFLERYVTTWRTNWQAGVIEAGILKRLSIQSPEKAAQFFDKLLSNPTNAPYTEWYHWYLLTSERRKAEAYKYAAEHHLDTSIRLSTSYPLITNRPPSVQIVWPHQNRTDSYSYSFGQKLWAAKVIPPTQKIVYVSGEWSPPSGTNYLRTWQRGPSWQITYTCTAGRLVRTATYVACNSHVEGNIAGRGFAESIVEEIQEPAGYLYPGPNIVVINR